MTTTSGSLRWWPAALLLIAMVILRMLPGMMESPSIEMFMLGFMGPAVLGLVVLVWWLLASRATWKERIIGFLAVVLFGFVSDLLCHFSLKGMNVGTYLVPVGIAAFALPLILLANRPSLRLPIALLSSFIGFGAWDLVRSEGVSGKFAPEFVWRWDASAEERYLKSLADQKPTQVDTGNDIKISLASAEWPSFRGPQRDAKLKGVSLVDDWKAFPPKLLWKRQIGPGWGSFSVAGDRLYTQEQRGEHEAIVCLDATTGEPVWVHEYTSRFWESVAGAGPRATPTIADEGLFSLGASGILTCLNASTGEKIWERDLQSDSNRKPPMWGFSSSPLVTDGLVIVHAGGDKDKGLLAYDASTGEPCWSIASGDHCYSSAQSATFDSVRGVLMQSNAGLQFVNAKDGSTIWQHDAPSKNYRTLQPLVVSNSVLMANSLAEGTKRLKVSREGENWTIKEEWHSRNMKPDFNDYVEHDGNLYGFDGDIFSCVEMATGKRLWKKGRYGNGQVLLLPDADQLLVTSEAGELVLLRADGKSMVELGKFQAIEGKTWNHSVVVGNRVYVRNSEQAACYELATH
jgi:outer membrane protein assembly factor BamB